MQNVRFTQLTDDTRIQSMGSLFRRVDGSQWGINVGFSPHQEKRSLSVSSAPVLVRKRVFNPTTEHGVAGYNLSFSIEDTRTWQTQTISDCPALRFAKRNKKEENQFCFSFRSDSGVMLYLPQFELARALFFHDGYLSRTAIEPDCLKAEFDINIDNKLNEARINVLPSSGYPRKAFEDYGARRVLSWILVDPDARASFESIGRHQKLFAKEYGGYRHWDFQFEPPPLPSAKFDVRGIFDRESNSMFVYEIAAIRNINVNMPEVVKIYHPQFREYVRGESSGGTRDASERPPEHYVHDGEDASSDNEHVLLKAPTVDFEFANPFKTVKIVDKKQEGAAGRKDEEVPDTMAEGVSVEEASEAGSLPRADWDSVSDVTDDAHIYANKFECFQQVLNHLANDFDCTIISKQFRKLPKVSRCKKHLLTTDGNPRCVVVVEIAVLGVTFHILEVDTSDSVSPLSTQIMLLKSTDEWVCQLEKLEKRLVSNSLHWPSGLLDEFCGFGQHKGVSHPKTASSDKGFLESDSVAPWAARFYSRMKTML